MSYRFINLHKTIDNENMAKSMNSKLKTNDIIDLFRKHVKEPFKHYCDKNPGYSTRMDEVVANAGSDHKVIVCMRDPRDIICSQVKYYNMPENKRPWKKLPWWVVSSPKEAIDSGYWFNYMKSLDQFLTTTTSDVYLLYFSDLIENPDIVQEELGLFLGLNMEEAFKKELILNKGYKQWKTMYPDLKLPKEWENLANKYNLLD
jgi:hypothetical protein